MLYLQIGEMGDIKYEDEDLLIDGLMKGDFQSFEKLYHKHVRELYFLSIGYLNNKSDAQDVVQEAFIYLWNNREMLKPDSNIKAYMRTIVKNASLNVIRNEKIKAKHQTIFAEKKEYFSDLHTNYQKHKEESEAFEEKLSLVRQKLEQLPKGCKKIFIMCVIDGFTYKEAAKKMGVSVNTVKTQVKIAYQKIRN